MRTVPLVSATRPRGTLPDRRTLGDVALVLSVGLPLLAIGYYVTSGLVALTPGAELVLALAGLVALLAVPLHFLTLRWHLAPLAERLVTDRKRLRETAARGARAQEVERIRIARDLRDDLAQLLASVLLRLRVVRSLPDGPEREGMLDEIGLEIGGSIDRVRSFAQAVHPPALAELGVTAGIRSYARTVTAGTDLIAEVEESGVPRPVLPETSLAVFRVVQEALGNAVRHAKSAHVRVRVIWETEGEVSAVVEDDGQGFDVESTEAVSPCLGLVTMNERALAVGGSLRIESAPGRGTVVTVTVPAVGGVEDRLATWPTILPSRV